MAKSEQQKMVDDQVDELVHGEPAWLVWSNEHSAWWKPAHRGYTEMKSEAGLYTFAEALEIVTGANKFLPIDAVPNEAMLPNYQESDVKLP